MGGSVVVNSASSIEAGERLADELSDRSFYVQADISEPEDRQRLVEQAVERMGGLDVLVNNAGWTTSIDQRELEAFTEEIFRKTFEVNVFGTWELTKLARPHLLKSSDPSVVTVTSIAGIRPIGSSVAYSMSKAALNHMTRLMAKSHGPIRFNAVAPGLVATPWTEDWNEMHEQVSMSAPLRRSATPEDIAQAVVGVLRSKYMTGAIVVVDGGLTQVL